MKRTLKITKGNQYDRDGYSITDGTNWSRGKADTTKPKGYSLNGDCWVGVDYDAYQGQVDAAILATMQDGQDRVIEMHKATPQISIPLSKACPKCGTYCMGDCDNG